MTTLSILYVDDDPDVRTIVGMSLGLDPAASVRIAASAAECLAMLAAGPRPDVVILDVMMPGMDGPQLVERMRADATTADIAVIFMTAKGRLTDLAIYRAHGAIGVILKPFDPITLAAEVRTILASSHGDRRES